MYKRRTGQLSMLDSPTMFGTIPLDSKNEWVKLSGIIPWMEFEERYAANFKSRKGQGACPARMALGALLIKERYGFSDEDVVAEIAMNPYLQYFLGLREFRYTAPFDASMLTRFRHRISGEMLAWVNDRVIGRPQPEDTGNDDDSGGGSKGSGSDGDSGTEETHEEAASESRSAEIAPANEGTMILDATCAPQDIRYPTDTSLLNEARISAEEIIDALHQSGLTDGEKPRTYREKALGEYNSFSKARRKTGKTIRKMRGKLLNYLARDLTAINRIVAEHPDVDLEEALTPRQVERLAVIIALYEQQRAMHEDGTRSVPKRIVSLSQYWVRPIVRGKQRAEVEFGSKVEMSVVDGYLRVEKLRWEAFNEGGTLIDSVESYRRAYGHYPARVLADKIFRTRENLGYCKERGIRINGPKLGKPPTDEAIRRQQLKEEWLESGERGEIERDFGVGKRRYSLGRIMMKLRDTSEVAVRMVVLAMNLWRKLRLLLQLLWNRLNNWSATFLSLQNCAIFTLADS